MGVCISAKNSKYDFYMGYFGFFNLRMNIAYALDKEFGRNYEKLKYCFSKLDFEMNDKIANKLIEEKKIDEDIVEFLYQPDSDGSISYKTCWKIYEIIKGKRFRGGRGFRYGAYRHNDYTEFKEFLKECYQHRRKMRWS